MSTAPAAQTIAVTSGKGGVGKSCIATNLAIAFSRQGQRTCLFDADSNLANINIMLGITPTHTLQQLLDGELAVEQLLLPAPAGLSIVPAASGIADFVHLSSTQQQRLVDALKSLEQQFQALLIDTAAGIDATLIQLLLAAPTTLLVITPEPTSLTDAFALLKVLKHHYFDRTVCVVVNRVSGMGEAHATFKRFRQTAMRYLQLEVNYLGYIINDPAMPASIRQQRALLETRPNVPASRCLQAIAGRLQQLLQRQHDAHHFSDHFARLLIEEQEQPLQAIQPARPVDHTAAARRHGLHSANHFAQLLGAYESGHDRTDEC